MQNDRENEIAGLLERVNAGDSEATGRLFELTYYELWKVAQKSLWRNRPADILIDEGDLLHEAMLRFLQQSSQVENKDHFIAVMALHMRRALVDHARKRLSDKRGGHSAYVELDDVANSLAAEPSSLDLVALDDALAILAQEDPRASRIVELKFFGGLTNEEIASALKLSPRTVYRDWIVAKGWLRRAIFGSEQGYHEAKEKR